MKYVNIWKVHSIFQMTSAYYKSIHGKRPIQTTRLANFYLQESENFIALISDFILQATFKTLPFVKFGVVSKKNIHIICSY